LFELLKFERNRAAGFRRRTGEVAGFGRRVIEQDDLRVDLESGPGLRQTIPNSGDEIRETIVEFIAELDWAFLPDSSFNEYFTVEAGQEFTTVSSLTAVTMQVSGRFSLRLSHEIRYDSFAPPGVEEMDTITSASLVYAF